MMVVNISSIMGEEVIEKLFAADLFLMSFHCHELRDCIAILFESVLSRKRLSRSFVCRERYRDISPLTQWSLTFLLNLQFGKQTFA